MKRAGRGKFNTEKWQFVFCLSSSTLMASIPNCRTWSVVLMTTKRDGGEVVLLSQERSFAHLWYREKDYIFFLSSLPPSTQSWKEIPPSGSFPWSKPPLLRILTWLTLPTLHSWHATFIHIQIAAHALTRHLLSAFTNPGRDPVLWAKLTCLVLVSDTQASWCE